MNHKKGYTMKLTREQFVGQFPYETDVSKITDILMLDASKFVPHYDGVEIYRALNVLLIKVNGKFYSHA